MPLYPLKNFKTQKYYQNEAIVHVFYSGNNLTKMQGWAYVIDLDDYQSLGTHWIALYVNEDCVTYCGSFGVEHILKGTKKFIGNKNITTNIYRILA